VEVLELNCNFGIKQEVKSGRRSKHLEPKMWPFEVFTWYKATMDGLEGVK
jgi:hypothetical protein